MMLTFISYNTPTIKLKGSLMRLEKVFIKKFRSFENVSLVLSKNDFPDVFSIASKNGGGKSTLLQFIFIMLSSFKDEGKKEFLKNLFYGNNINKKKDDSIATFNISHNDNEYTLEFLYTKNKKTTELVNLDIFLDEKDLEKKISIAENTRIKYKNVINLKKELEATDRITPVLIHYLEATREFVNSSALDRMYKKALTSTHLEDFQKYLESITRREDANFDDIAELEIIYNNLQQRKNLLQASLKDKGMLYITHLYENDLVLLLKTDMPEDLLEELTNKVYLNAPMSQIFLFLREEEKNSIFNSFGKRRTFATYEDYVRRTKDLLKTFYTYDFASTELILNSFEKAFIEDKKIKKATGSYGDKYDKLVVELNNFLEGKEISEDEESKRVIFKIKNSSQELRPEDLSHGELKKLSIYIWLKYIVPNDAIILMDEIDIALHPKWQYQIINDIIQWSDGQFLLATHSPQILSSTYFKNLIKIDNKDSKIIVTQYEKPPLDRDINTIIMEIMGAPAFPENLFELHDKYKNLAMKGKKDSKEALILKKQILEYESENSSFFQELNFDLELM